MKRVNGRYRGRNTSTHVFRIISDLISSDRVLGGLQWQSDRADKRVKLIFKLILWSCSTGSLARLRPEVLWATRTPADFKGNEMVFLDVPCLQVRASRIGSA